MDECGFGCDLGEGERRLGAREIEDGVGLAGERRRIVGDRDAGWLKPGECRRIAAKQLRAGALDGPAETDPGDRLDHPDQRLAHPAGSADHDQRHVIGEHHGRPV